MERTLQQQREHRKNHLEQYRKAGREWARRNPKPYFWNDSKVNIQRRYRAKHKEKLAVKRRARFKEQIKTDIIFRLRWLLRSRVMIALKSNLANKAYKTIELLGCSIEQARKHIEAQFKDGMSWDNHGAWEIDHIIPIASFDLTKPEEQKRAFHYTNLQPLIKIDNRKKGARLPTGR